MNYAILRLDLEWPDEVKTVLFFFQKLAVDLKVFAYAPECLFPDTWMFDYKLIVVNVFPIVCLVGFALWWLFWRVYTSRRGEGSASAHIEYLKNGKQNSRKREDLDHWSQNRFVGFLVLLSWGYMSIADVNLEYLNCQQVPEAQGRWYMVAEPSMECGATNRPMIVLAIAGILIYVIGIPCLFAFLLFKQRRILRHRRALDRIAKYGEGSTLRKGKKGSKFMDAQLVLQLGGSEKVHKTVEEAKRQFGFLFRRYHPRHFWFELPVLMLKLYCTVVLHLPLPLVPEERAILLVPALFAYLAYLTRIKPHDNSALEILDCLGKHFSPPPTHPQKRKNLKGVGSFYSEVPAIPQRTR